MSARDAATGNAASRRSVDQAGQFEHTRKQQQKLDLEAVLSTPQGRRYMWRLLGEICGVFESVWRPSAEIHYLSGKQDVGHEIMAEIARDHRDLYITMMQENQNA